MEEIVTKAELERCYEMLVAHRDELLVKYIRQHPELGYTEIGEKFGMYEQEVFLIARAHGIVRKRGVKPKMQTTETI